MHPLRQWRTQNGLTLAEVAGLSGIHISAISRIERGIIKPRVRTKLRIARALGARVDALFPPGDSHPGRSRRGRGRPAEATP